MKILAALADEQSARPLVEWICLQSWPAGIKFQLLHVTRDPLVFGSISIPGSASHLPFMEQAKKQLVDRFGEVNVGISFDFGDPAVAIFTELSRIGYQMVIVGRHSSSWASSCDPGTVCQRLLSHSPVPVLFLPSFTHAAPEQLQHCIISIKDSETATWILPRTVQTLLGSLATDFCVATIGNTNRGGEIGDKHIDDEFLMSVATTLEKGMHPKTMQISVKHGDLVEAIAELCQTSCADLVVVGKSMSRFYAHHADEILRRSNYPVLLVTPTPSPLEVGCRPVRSGT